jgi:hypothetical protein
VGAVTDARAGLDFLYLHHHNHCYLYRIKEAKGGKMYQFKLIVFFFSFLDLHFSKIYHHIISNLQVTQSIAYQQTYLFSHFILLDFYIK